MTNRRWAVGARDPWQEVTVDGVTLAYNDEGAGLPIVCLHAIGHGAADFTALLDRWRGRHRVIALDWPGQGRSRPDRVPACATRYTQLLAGLLDALEVPPAVLLGNSIGGAVAIRYAAANPGRVQALVLENPGGLAPTGDVLARSVLAAMARFFAAGARGARWFPAAFAGYYRLCVLQRQAAAAHRQRIVAAASELAPLLLAAWRSFGDPAEDLRALAPAVTCPVLFAWARRDQFVQLRRSRDAMRRFPAGRLETFPAGHAPHLETPEAFAAATERFLAEVAPPASMRHAALGST